MRVHIKHAHAYCQPTVFTLYVSVSILSEALPDFILEMSNFVTLVA